MILHICAEEAWRAAKTSGAYAADSLATEGFIHCSRPDQLIDSANRHYRGRRNLLILVIDPSRVTAEIKLEQAKNGQEFPHIYGSLNRDAVVAVEPLEYGPDNTFIMPNLD